MGVANAASAAAAARPIARRVARVCAGAAWHVTGMQVRARERRDEGQ